MSSTESSRESSSITSSNQARLDAAYQRACVITRQPVVKNCHLIPYCRYQHDIHTQYLESRNLIPEGMRSTSYLNMVPLTPTLHAWFELGMFTFYPTVEVLLQLIEHEERQIFERSQAIAATGKDTGRPSYESYYDRLPEVSQYHVCFLRRHEDTMDTQFFNSRTKVRYSINSSKASETEPLVPDIALACSPNIVIQTRTGLLAAPLLPDGLESQIHHKLGMYIMELWDFSPMNDDLKDLLELRPSSVPPGWLTTISPSSSSSSKAARKSDPGPVVRGIPAKNMQVDGVVSTLSRVQPRAGLLPLTPPSSPDQRSMLKIGNQFYPLSERGSSIRCNSNDWARLHYGVDLTSSSKPDGQA